ncbi:MAG: TIGR00730 family Rossman fold protein [Prevotellaceae bacterium]|jgi:uncharacterized protein (TIGR00730 family)|nr:TIGR00730 family Rossman fold protein [Prevotellaceae bacterium]
MKNIAVFCASSSGQNEIYASEAKKLGEILAGKGLRLVYGGASRGLMNTVAEAVLQNGGQVTGIIPRMLADLEITKTECTEIIYTSTMQERKVKMIEIADAVIVLPGGFGTLDEMFEVLTLSRLGLFTAPTMLLNTNGYYNLLSGFIDHMASEGFLEKSSSNMLTICSSLEDLIEKIIKI